MALTGIIEIAIGFTDQAENLTDPKTLLGSVSLFTALLAVAVLVGLATKILKIPYTVALVLAGLVIALFQKAPYGAELHPDLVLYIILPPILFRAGLHIDVKSLGRNWLPVFIVTIIGTILTMGVVGVAIHSFLTPDLISSNLSWVAAFMVGAMVAPTDPVSVMSIIRSVRLPKRVRTIIEGESLFNDGVAVVVFFILFGAIFPPILDRDSVNMGPGINNSIVSPVDKAEHDVHEIFSEDPKPITDSTAVVNIWSGILRFLGNTGVGLLVGGLLGLGAVYLMRWVNDPVLENTMTIVLAYGSFIVTSQLHYSGVAAVIVAGIIVGVTRWRDDSAEESVETMSTFWASIDYIMNSVIFLLVGFELQFIGAGRLLDHEVLLAIGFVYLAILVARAAVICPARLLLKEAWPRPGSLVVFWAGLRGCVTLSLVLILPDSYMGVDDGLKEFLLPVVFGVVLLTLILQATTMRPLILLTGCYERD